MEKSPSISMAHNFEKWTSFESILPFFSSLDLFKVISYSAPWYITITPSFGEICSIYLYLYIPYIYIYIFMFVSKHLKHIQGFLYPRSVTWRLPSLLFRRVPAEVPATSIRCNKELVRSGRPRSQTLLVEVVVGLLRWVIKISENLRIDICWE